jgi:hypothetical protein
MNPCLSSLHSTRASGVDWGQVEAPEEAGVQKRDDECDPAVGGG